MKRLAIFSVFFLVICSNVVMAAENMEYKHVDRSPTMLEQKTFDTLKKKFPGEIIDGSLKNLREISKSQEYLNFLSEKYPHLKPVESFEVIDKMVVPPKALYFKFFNEQFLIPTLEEVQDDEQWFVHRIMTTRWAFEACKRGNQSIYVRPTGQVRKGVLLNPIGNKVIKRRLGFSPKKKYTKTREDQQELGILVLLDQPLFPLAMIHLDEDVRWLKMLFEKHGRSDGILWAIIQDPILFDRILYTFATDKAFLKCLYDPIDVEAETRKRLGMTDSKKKED